MNQNDLAYNIFGNNDSDKLPQPSLSDIDFTIITKRLPIKFSEYKISNTPAKMTSGETVGLSLTGINFYSPWTLASGSLLRIWLEIPKYWERKSKYVAYQHTESPSFFQILGRLVKSEETGKKLCKHQVFCQIVNIEDVDLQVLKDFLEIGT